MDEGLVRGEGVAVHSRNGAGAPAHSGRHGKKSNKIRNIAIIAGIILVAALSFVGWSFYQSSVSAHIDKDKYQAVFLTNGQVYFGKLQRLNGDYYQLTDIFYLQTKTTDSSTNPQKTTTDETTDVQLIKLGSEVHGPEDEMIMTKDQILFIENLKKDGTVSKTIVNYK